MTVEPEAPPGVWLEPAPPVQLSLEWLKIPGLERLRTSLGGEMLAPFSRLTGLRGVDFGEGWSVFEMPVTGWLRSSAGVIPGGVMAFMADSPLGSSVMTTNPPGTVITTSEMSLNYLRPVPSGASHLVARASLVHSGRSFALSEVRISDPEGKLVAHGTARNLMVELPVPEGPFELPDAIPFASDRPDPYLREPVGEVLPADTWRRMTGLQILQAQVAGQLPHSPIASLFGITVSAAGEGTATIKAPATGWLMSPANRLYGGATALLADTALTFAGVTTVPAGSAIAPLDLRIQFLRPLAGDGADIEVRARVVHRGRTMGFVNAEILNGEGKVAALATQSFLVVEGFNWAADPWEVPAGEEEA